ncbi:phosphorylase family protein [Rhodovastum atsumiense]|uniref:phosphorylase family protein n=1 Tax=Rhodovastum atsumiense TaxID=504468 RepID=UPI001EF11D64|nr:hypothetical protein [Rhodovastum atsumiense]
MEVQEAKPPGGAGAAPRIGVVTGLTAEARIATPLGLVAAGGGTPIGAATAAERLVAQGVKALVSFGLAGGLDPALRPGDIVVPADVLDGDCRHRCDPALAARFGDVGGTLLAEASVVVEAAAKVALFARTGAGSVDLESGAVARVAARHGLAFAVLRAICDPAGRTLPPAALVALTASGRIGMVRVLASVARQPSQIPTLLALGRDAAAARRALLRRVAQAAG